ncbi:MAG: MBL fold metallo-hydrolase [Woeseiaceae bacterium]|nr:MBL fold metallo-hydrolase [Woeseiaceae bacterium]
MQYLVRSATLGILLSLIVAVLGREASGQETSSIQYLGNEGVMVTQGDLKILFDPLFDNDFGRYQRVPQAMRDALFAGDPPYDGVAAVFVSHFHGDHFSAADLARLLRERSDIRLYAPAQAVQELRRVAGDEAILERVTGFDLEYGDAPTFVRKSGLLIEILSVPHAGWPTARTDVQNIVFRVTLDDTSTIVHLGDADARLVHFDKDRAFWDERRVDLALPPYWFLLSDDGREILSDRIYARHSIGIHVPVEYADNPSSMPEALFGEDLFLRPGEGRRFTGSQ